MKGPFKLFHALSELDVFEITEVEGGEGPDYSFLVEGVTQYWRIEVKWLNLTTLPTFFLAEEHCIKHRPHVSWCRVICYSDDEGIFFTQDNLVSVLGDALRQAVNVVEQGNAGDPTVFFHEIEGYFNTIDLARGKAHCYFDFDDKPRKMDSFVIPSKTRQIAIYDKKEQCWGFGKQERQLSLQSQKKSGQRRTRKMKYKKPISNSPQSYYLPLDEPISAPLPGRPWQASDVISVVEPFISQLPELETYLKKKHQRYVFSVSRPEFERGAFAVEIALNNKAKPVIYFKVMRRSSSYLKKRGGVPKTLQQTQKKIAIIGCGSVGGRLACVLAQSGFNALTLVDLENYEAENLYRHVLPKSYIGKHKAQALKQYIESSYIDMTVTAVEKDALSWSHRENLEGHDIVITATGNPALEYQLANRFSEVARDGQALVSAWNEPLGLGGHVVLQSAGSKGCLGCLYTQYGRVKIHPAVSFIEAGQNVTRNLTGCGGAFSPFSTFDSQQTVLMVMRNLESFVAGNLQSRYDCWLGGSKAATQNHIRTSPVYDGGFKNKAVWWEERLQIGCSVCCKDDGKHDV